MYFVKTPNIIKPLYRDLTWNIPSDDKVVYLTFDDGPTPEITDRTLEILDEFNAKATFFLVGSNVASNPAYLSKYEEKGHAIGNHTYTHMNGWNSVKEDYLSDVQKASNVITSSLFRPPYGKVKREQAKSLKKDYQIIMWDVLSGDFDPSVDAQQCYKNVVENVESGSIIVFHDSIKAKNTMLPALPRILEELTEKSYEFKTICV